MLIDGKIKLKNGTQIERFTEKGLKFQDGSELEADVVVLATGCVCHTFPHPSSLLTYTPDWPMRVFPSVTLSVRRTGGSSRRFGG